MIKRVLILTILLALLPLGARSEVLGTAEFSVQNSNYGTVYLPMIMLQVGVSGLNPAGVFDPVYDLRFDYTRLDTTDVDTVLVAEVDDVNFLHTVSNLTNNIPQYVGVAFYLPSSVCCGYGGPVVYETEQLAFSLESIDFFDANITSISIRLDDLTFDAVDGNTFEVWDFYCRVTVLVEGTWDNVATENTSWGYIKSMYSQ